jgi:N-acetylglucosamine kinase-like BadF-type ATPase
MCVDGGNSKTEVLAVDLTGRILARTRGVGVDSPLQGLDRWRDTLVTLVDKARATAGLPPTAVAERAVYHLANVDLPDERSIARRELARAVPALTTVVQNDTFAVLRAGITRPWGVAVVAGAGINAVGVHPSGRVARFLALGGISGDCGGGHDLGLEGLGAAVRARDGRGPATSLAVSIPAYYGLRRPYDVAVAVHRGTIANDDLHALAPVVFAAAQAGDAVAVRILADFAAEVAVMAGALIRRLHLTRTDVEVILGGGTLQAGDPAVLRRITEDVHATCPRAVVRVLDVPPVFGTVVEALTGAGAGPAAVRRARAAL